jgi:hypothetical protein
MPETPRARLVAYGVAVLGPAVTLLVRWPLEAVLGDRVLYMTFVPAVLVAASFGGSWPPFSAPWPRPTSSSNRCTPSGSPPYTTRSL